MKRAHLILFIGGALVAVGMILSYIGATLIAQEVAITEGIVNQDSPIEFTTRLSPNIAATGKFVIIVEGSSYEHLIARLYDPAGDLLATKEINQKSTEEKFQIDRDGNYTLILKKSDSGDIPIVIGLTHEPEKALVALNTLGQSLILSGFIGVVISFVYFIINRKKN